MASAMMAGGASATYAQKLADLQDKYPLRWHPASIAAAEAWPEMAELTPDDLLSVLDRIDDALREVMREPRGRRRASVVVPRR